MRIILVVAYTVKYDKVTLLKKKEYDYLQITK